MTKSVDEIVVGANGSILVAPEGTAVPAGIETALGEDWIDLGYVTEDGVSFSDGKSVASIRAWQSFYDLRRVIESREATAGFSLMQWNGSTVALAFGGGDVTEDASSQYRYTPPDPGEIDYRALAIEWEDGDRDYRLVLPRGMVSEGVETNIVRTEAGVLPISFAVLGEAGSDPWVMQTNDPAFAAAVGS